MAKRKANSPTAGPDKRRGGAPAKSAGGSKRKGSNTNMQRSVAAVAPSDWGAGRHIAWWALLTMIFITPVAISNLSFLGLRMPLSYDQFDIIKVFCQRVFTLIALTAWSWDIVLKGGKIRRTPVDWLILGLIGWITLSTVFSIHIPTAFFGKYRRFEGLLSFINYAVIYFLVIQMADRPSRIKRIAQAIFWSGILVNAYGLMQAFGKDILQWGQLPFELYRSFSTYGNPDLLGGFLMFSTFISIGLALAESNLMWRGIYWFGFLMSSAVTVTAFTRSAWVGSVAGFFFILLFAIRQRVEWKVEDWVFGGAAAAASIGFIIRSLSTDHPVMNFAVRVKSIFQFGEGSALTRFEIWRAALNAISDRPIFGFGPDTFRLIFPKYKPIEYVGDAGYLSVADNVHNYPLQLATGIGVPGVLTMYGVFGWVAARSWRLVWTKDGQNRMLLIGFWSACAAYVTHLFFGLSVTGSSFLVWTCMGVLMAPTAKTVSFKVPYWAILIPGIVTVIAVVGIVYQFIFMSADRAYLMARIGTQGADRTAYAERAVKLNPWNDMYRAEVGLALTDETLSALNAVQTGGENQQQAFEQARSTFLRAEKSLLSVIEFVPWEYDNYVFITNLYNLAGQFFDPTYNEKAIEMGLRGKEVEPFGPAIRLQLARAYVATGQNDKAIKELEEAYAMDKAYVELGQLLVSLYEEEGKLEDAVRIQKLLAKAAPTNTEIADKLRTLELSETTSPATP